MQPVSESCDSRDKKDKKEEYNKKIKMGEKKTGIKDGRLKDRAGSDIRPNVLNYIVHTNECLLSAAPTARQGCHPHSRRCHHCCGVHSVTCSAPIKTTIGTIPHPPWSLPQACTSLCFYLDVLHEMQLSCSDLHALMVP